MRTFLKVRPAICLATLVLLATSCSAPPSNPPPPGAPPAAAPPPPAAPASQESAAPAAPPVAPKPIPVVQPPSPGPKAAPTQTPDTIPASRADVIAKDGRTVSVRVGQTLGVPQLGAGMIWQVDYDEDRLTPLTPRNKMTQPGEAGWVFRAKASGLVEISLTGRAPCATPPCETNPPKMTYSVQITDRF